MEKFRIAVLAMLLLTPAAHAEEKVTAVPAFPHLSFEQPVDLQAPGDGSGRLFVVEQNGTIRVFANDPEVRESAVFLDIHERIAQEHSEEGLLGLAFHPDFKTNGFFYVNYTAPDPLRTVIARYSVSAQDPQKADPASEKVVLEFLQPYANHNGGQIAFGPDGFLYIAAGDGGSGGDPHGNGQSRGTLLGKILRIDVNREEKGLAYAIPGDNPYAGNHEGLREEIFAYGLRNPWRFSFDSQGRLWAGDVGQDRIEEIDRIEKGKNYGWNVMEGSLCFSPDEGCPREGLELPVAEYGRDKGQCVTGGHVYEGEAVPYLKGRYVYADFLSNRVWALREKPDGGFEPEELMQTSFHTASFGVDEKKELYFCAFDGQIYRLEAAGKA
ncbi:MAG TPA: PQQ-dependent sugar dehydrogenase [Verrucomicrobiae bacterium]|nr:PQQ-dependent sugar dehydrogenase [Verrucomicrobiae bacterium]